MTQRRRVFWDFREEQGHGMGLVLETRDNTTTLHFFKNGRAFPHTVSVRLFIGDFKNTGPPVKPFC